ncbi:MAG: FAD/NAD(P)-binding protein [Candidatus Kuenenbacteria bacterium]
MINLYQSKTVIIKNIKTQTKEVKLFTLCFKNKKDQKDFFFFPGQFIEVGLFGFGEAPFALCSSSLNKKFFQICVRKVGQLTEKLHKLKINDEIQIRGPYGNGFPKIEDSKNLLLIGGGIGLVPLRSVIQTMIDQKQKENKIILFYGAKNYDDLLFKNEYKQWEKFLDLHITLDKPNLKWKGNVGLITTLFDKINLQSKIFNLQTFLCGPPVMYKFIIQKLKELKIPDKNIFLSLERRMHCGVGICQHCAIDSKYVCKDGPVFNYAEVKKMNKEL